ncbi:MAG: tripartite ATP-independent periplasmic transporter DctQ component [Spirochaetes bacterium]|nr:MAG: tripartite ATP-independent periplasmic transporter DctQ component [Spirochaetota bacterium]
MRNAIMRIVGRAERVLTAIAAIVMAALSVVVCWQVFARYVLQKSPIWVEEFSVTAIMWIGLLGAASAVWTGDHMRLELVTKKLPEAWGVAVEVAIDLAICAFALFLFRHGLVLTQAMWSSRMSTIKLPLGITYLVLPIAAVFMIGFAALRASGKILDASAKGKERKEGKHAR